MTRPMEINLKPVDRRSFFRLGAIAAGYTGLAIAGGSILEACGSSVASTSAAATLTSVGIQFNYLENVQFGGSFLAKQEGYYKAEGFDVTLLPGGADVSVEPVVVAGKAFVGISHTADCIPAIINGAPLTVIGAGYQRNPNCVVSKASAPITTPTDMVGKRIGVDPPSASLFDAFRKANGLENANIDVVTVGYDLQPLIDGEIDGKIAYITNEPIILEEQGIKTAVLAFYANNLPFMEELYVARTADVNNPATLKQLGAFMRAEAMGWAKAVTDPVLAATVATDIYGKSQNLSLSQQELEAKAQIPFVSTPDTEAHGLFWMTNSNIARTLRSLAIGGVHGQASFFSNKVLREAYSGGPVV